MPTLKKGDVLGDTYEIRHFIGEGAFGEAYRVRHKFLGSQVLKLFKQVFVENAEVSQFVSEAQILSGLTHKNIVRVFDANTARVAGSERFYMTMEFVSGETLGQLLTRQIKLPVHESLELAIGFLTGLENAHSHKPSIIHRDISPDNILLEYGNVATTIKLGDFGLATSFDVLSEIPCAGGKYLYFAPECFWNAYLPASDIFSSGVVIYRMLTGCFPWSYEIDDLLTKRDFAPRIQKTRKRSPVPPSAFDDSISPELDRVVLKSIELDTEVRYSNVREFLRSLEMLTEVSGHA